MKGEKSPIATFLEGVMRRRRLLSSQLATDLGISHSTIRHWLSDEKIPNIRSCHKLADYTGIPLKKVLSIAGHPPSIADKDPIELPEFGMYMRQKYPAVLDEDVIMLIEDLIEKQRQRKYKSGNF